MEDCLKIYNDKMFMRSYHDMMEKHRQALSWLLDRQTTMTKEQLVHELQMLIYEVDKKYKHLRNVYNV